MDERSNENVEKSIIVTAELHNLIEDYIHDNKEAIRTYKETESIGKKGLISFDDALRFAFKKGLKYGE